MWWARRLYKIHIYIYLIYNVGTDIMINDDFRTYNHNDKGLECLDMLGQHMIGGGRGCVNCTHLVKK